MSLRNSALDPLLVSKRDAAALLGVCLRSVDNYIATKELLARRLGKRVLIPYSALLAFARRDHVNPARSKASEISPNEIPQKPTVSADGKQKTREQQEI